MSGRKHKEVDQSSSSVRDAKRVKSNSETSNRTRSNLTTAVVGDADAEEKRLREGRSAWRLWGSYLSERQWGTVREDLSIDGNCWEYFSHDDAVFRAYKSGEDGLLGICDEQARLCFAVALWNGHDRILKERLFGLASKQGNHGEDVKELYYYLDATPTHSYMRALYKYPQAAFPYDELLETNSKRTLDDPEFEIMDTGVFDSNEYWDVFAEYAKATASEDEQDILCRYTVHNRGSKTATLHLLPTIWFRNSWQQQFNMETAEPDSVRPMLNLLEPRTVRCSDISSLGEYRLAVDSCHDSVTSSHPRMLFTNNETNKQKLVSSHPVSSATSDAMSTHRQLDSAWYSKDAFHELVVHNNEAAVNGDNTGTKCAAWYKVTVLPGSSATVRCRLYRSCPKRGVRSIPVETLFGQSFDDMMEKRHSEANDFYNKLLSSGVSRGPALHTLSLDEQHICLQAFAGLCWTKQFYRYDGPLAVACIAQRERDLLASVQKRLRADSSSSDECPAPRKLADGSDNDGAQSEKSSSDDGLPYVSTRNKEWAFLQNGDIISMPDKFEFPWYATWDLAFHVVAFARIDPEFAKAQLLLLLSDRYQHESGQLPAYEFDFSDVNPPVHAWACLRVYRQTANHDAQDPKPANQDTGDILFLKSAFNKLIINFAWWVNRKDPSGCYLFGGGFLGMDNVSCIDRSNLPQGFTLHQADATAWMAFYAACMLDIVLELARNDTSYEGLAITYLNFYVRIADAINADGSGLWNSEDGFFYDRLIGLDGESRDLRIHSLVGLVSLFPVLCLTPDRYRHLKMFSERLGAVHSAITGVAGKSSSIVERDKDSGVLLSLVSDEQLTRILRYVLDTNELLSDYGVRSLSKIYSGEGNEYKLSYCPGDEKSVSYCPGESNSDMFGGNSNWRGPVWICMNYLLIDSLETYGTWYGDRLKVALPSQCKNLVSLRSVADDIRRRVISLFLTDGSGRRPLHGSAEKYASDPYFKDLILFYEYFHGDTGAGCGASHQTGWTALVANLLLEHRD